ncbi:MAG: hypothetical protein AB8B50_18780 [Pirellulaceae bacterium]
MNSEPGNLSDSPLNSESEPPLVDSAAAITPMPLKRRTERDWERDWERLFEKFRIQSFVALGGLIGLTVVCALLFPVLMWLVEEFDIRPRPFYIFSLMLQSATLPPLTCGAFLVGTIMFWYGSILVRFIAATLAVLPAIFACTLTVSVLVSNVPLDDFLRDILIGMLPALITSAAVGVVLQLASRWTLTHVSPPGNLPPSGIRSLVELTLVTAVCLAVIGAISRVDEYYVVMTVFAIIALLTTLAVVASQIAFLQENRTRLNLVRGIVYGLFACFSVCLFANYFFIVFEFGSGEFSVDLLLGSAYFAIPLALYGCLLVGTLVALQVWWLWYCGWRCVDQTKYRSLDAEGLPGKPVAEDPFA